MAADQKYARATGAFKTSGQPDLRVGRLPCHPIAGAEATEENTQISW